MKKHTKKLIRYIRERGYSARGSQIDPRNIVIETRNKTTVVPAKLHAIRAVIG